jgi:hypothetical protein
VSSSRPARARSVETRTVSRKTPGDGKLEITKAAAHALESLGATFSVRVHTQTGEASLGTMPCTCRGKETPHVHYFIESDLFRALVPGSSVELMVDETDRRLHVIDT